MTEIMIPIGIVSGMGLIAGVILSLATIIFHKPVDEKEEALREALPGINCGLVAFPAAMVMLKRWLKEKQEPPTVRQVAHLLNKPWQRY